MPVVGAAAISFRLSDFSRLDCCCWPESSDDFLRLDLLTFDPEAAVWDGDLERDLDLEPE